MPNNLSRPNQIPNAIARPNTITVCEMLSSVISLINQSIKKDLECKSNGVTEAEH
jgi:hypothetical protein